MSKLSYLIALLVLLIFVSCEDNITSSQVPSVVKNTFKNKFAQAKNMEWEFTKQNYEVSFEIEDVDHDALLDSFGNILKYKVRIDRIAIPKNIRIFLERKYPKEKWDDAEYIVDGESNYYQIELESFFTDKNLVVDSNGKVLSNIEYWN